MYRVHQRRRQDHHLLKNANLTTPFLKVKKQRTVKKNKLTIIGAAVYATKIGTIMRMIDGERAQNAKYIFIWSAPPSIIRKRTTGS